MQDRTHLATSYASPERLANSEANSSPCHISQAGSHLEYRVVTCNNIRDEIIRKTFNV